MRVCGIRRNISLFPKMNFNLFSLAFICEQTQYLYIYVWSEHAFFIWFVSLQYYPSAANQVTLGEQDVLHANAHNQWHEHVQESCLWQNVSCAVATDAPTTIAGNKTTTIRRTVTNGSQAEAEKLHDPDIAATLNQHYQLQRQHNRHLHHHHTLRQQQKL